MTVIELIAKLSKHDPHSDVFFEHAGEWHDVGLVRLPRKDDPEESDAETTVILETS